MRRFRSSCGQQRVRISTLLRAYGRIYPNASMEWVHYLEISLGFMQQCTMNDRASHKRPSDGLMTSVARRFVPSCRLQIDMSLLMNSWMDFLSHHYLCVKFSLRLMHDIHSLIHVEKSILKGHFQPIKANKINSEKKCWYFFLLDILRQLLLTIIKLDF